MSSSRTPRSVAGRSVAGALTLLALLGGLIACSPGYQPTPVPPPATTAEVERVPAEPQNCDNATTSYEPDGLQIPDGSTMSRIQDRGRLIAGVSGDTYLLAARNPATGTIEGFDIDIVKAIAAAIFDDPDAYELRVITAADRIPLLQSGEVDVVVRAMTMTCDRWQEVAFSSVYYEAGQKVMVRAGSGIESLADLAGRRVCAPKSTSSLDTLLREVPEATLVPANDHTGCLVRFQTGEVDAITGDDTVLAGLAAQDPYARVLATDAFTSEPYGVAVNSDAVDLARYINAVLEQLRDDGGWQDSYDKWLRPVLGKATPPKPRYGR